MGSPYVGEIRIFAGNFAPVNWEFCSGQSLSIEQNQTLYQLIGTTYGGNGNTTFQLPDLRGRLPLHMGTGQSSYTLGESGGVEQVTLTTIEIPTHNHSLGAASSGQVSSPAGALPAVATSEQVGVDVYGPTGSSPTTLNPATIAQNAGDQPHNNLQPFLAVSFIISLFGIFPTQG
jgi:microcystin-dependent protein